MYPTDQAGRQQLADELTAAGFKPAQLKDKFILDKINRIAKAMKDGTFDWKIARLRPIILGPGGEVLGGHHRIVSAHLAGVDLTVVPGPRPQIQHVSRCFRPEYHWNEVLPEVQ